MSRQVCGGNHGLNLIYLTLIYRHERLFWQHHDGKEVVHDIPAKRLKYTVLYLESLDCDQITFTVRVGKKSVECWAIVLWHFLQFYCCMNWQHLRLLINWWHIAAVKWVCYVHSLTHLPWIIVSHQKSLHTPYVFNSTLNCFVNCETKQFEYKACSFYYEVWSCNVFLCIALGSVPLLFRWIFIDCFCLANSHHLALLCMHLTSFGQL